MTRDSAVKATDFAFKILVPVLLLLLGIIGSSINDRLKSLSSDVNSLQKEVQVRIEGLRIEQAILKEQVKSLKGG